MRASIYPLVDADEAAALVLERTPVLAKERVAIGEAVGRVQVLKDQTDALSLEKERLATLLAHLTAGVVAVGEGSRVLLANPAAAALGGGRAGADTLEEVFPGDAMVEVRRLLADPAAAKSPSEVQPRPGER